MKKARLTEKQMVKVLVAMNAPEAGPRTTLERTPHRGGTNRAGQVSRGRL